MASLHAVLKVALIAGLLAGASTAGFHTLFLEPLIERAIELEEHAAKTHGEPASEPLIDRRTQRWGLVLGFLVYGALWGALFGLLVYFLQHLRPATWTIRRTSFALALLIGWSVAILPFLKYPANPPGVGEPETVGYRQALYLVFLGLSALGTAVAVGVHDWRRRSSPSPFGGRGVAMMLAAYIVYVLVVYLAMPENPDPVKMPADLVWPFRAIAGLGLMLFWVVLGGAFGWLWRDAPQPSPAV